MYILVVYVICGWSARGGGGVCTRRCTFVSGVCVFELPRIIYSWGALCAISGCVRREGVDRVGGGVGVGSVLDNVREFPRVSE